MERKIYLNRYRVCVDQIGIPIVIRRSANEATVQADDIKTGEQVAVQLIPLSALPNATRERVEARAQAAQQINHPNIPVLRDYGFEGEQLIWVTEYFDGTTVGDWVKTKGPMPVSVVLRIAAQVVSALGAATFHAVVHRAINPSNLMLVPGQTAEGEWPLIKVVNFIGAKPEPEFISPEQREKKPVDFRSQIYSLGATLWFLLKGSALVGGVETVQTAEGIPAPLRRLLLPMLADDPEEPSGHRSVSIHGPSGQNES